MKLCKLSHFCTLVKIWKNLMSLATKAVFILHFKRKMGEGIQCKFVLLLGDFEKLNGCFCFRSGRKGL